MKTMTAAKTENAMRPMRTALGGQILHEAEGGAGVDDVRQAEDAGDDGDVVAGTDAVDDRVLGRGGRRG